MPVVITPPDPDLNLWRHEKIPVQRMPAFSRHRVVSPEGWWLDLEVSRSERDEPTYWTFTRGGPHPGRARHKGDQFRVALTALDDLQGTRFDATAKVFFEDLFSAIEEEAPVSRLLEGVRAMLKFVSEGAWDVRQFVVFEPVIYLKG